MGYLKYERYDYFSGLKSFEEVKNDYVRWMNRKDYMVFVDEPVGEQELSCCAIKCSKRGNDVYRNRIRKRFKDIYDMTYIDRDIVFLDENETSSNMFFVTLTYDTKLTDIDDAWFKIGEDLNIFLTNMRNDFGKIQVLRCFESFKNGYPHVHMILIFSESALKVYKKSYMTKKGIRYRYLMDIPTRELIASHWHSHIKIEGLRNMGGVYYILKYLIKEQFSQNGYDTNARLWLYGKRSYSMSRDFVAYLSIVVDIVPSQLDTSQHNSKPQYELKYFGTYEMTKDFNKFFFFFFLKLDDEFNSNIWSVFNDRLFDG